MAQAVKTTPTPPFRIPSGVSLVRINAVTGALAAARVTRRLFSRLLRSVHRAFGWAAKQAVVGGSPATGTNTQLAVVREDEAVGVGTGGLY
jgi:hypothetical protein